MPKYTSTGDAGGALFVDPGEYEFIVHEAEEQLSKAGNEMIKLTLRIQPQNTTVFDYLVFSEKNAWKIDSFLASLGGEIAEGKEIDVQPAMLKGRSGRAQFTTEEYEGRKSNKVGAYLQAGDAAEPEPLTPQPEEATIPFK